MTISHAITGLVGVIDAAPKLADAVSTAMEAISKVVDVGRELLESYRRPAADDTIRFTWSGIETRQAAGFADERPDMLPAEVLLEGMSRLGEQGRRMIQRLAPELAKLEADNPGKVIFVKLK